jgi:hypothetical protein
LETARLYAAAKNAHHSATGAERGFARWVKVEHMKTAAQANPNYGQPILDFIFCAHMIKPVYFVKPLIPCKTEIGARFF